MRFFATAKTPRLRMTLSAEDVDTFMKALITGGAGFVGSNLVRRLIDERHTIAVMDNLSSGYRVNLDPFPQVEFIEGDVRDAVTVERAMHGVEAVFYLASSVATSTRSIIRWTMRPSMCWAH